MQFKQNTPGYPQAPTGNAFRPPPPGVNGFSSSSSSPVQGGFRPLAPSLGAVNGPNIPPVSQNNQSVRPGLPPQVGMIPVQPPQGFQRPPMSGQAPDNSARRTQPSFQGSSPVPGMVRPNMPQPPLSSQGEFCSAHNMYIVSKTSHHLFIP